MNLKLEDERLLIIKDCLLSWLKRHWFCFCFVLLNMMFHTEDPFYLNTLAIMLSEVTQLCPILCDPMDCSLLGFSVHGIFQARILEWVAISFSRGTS